MNISWAWTHDLLHGCLATYPLHQCNQLLTGVEETCHNEEIVKCKKEELFSITWGDAVWNAADFKLLAVFIFNRNNLAFL